MSGGLDLDALRTTGRNADGTFAHGHLVNLRHGLRTAPDHPELVAAHEERVTAIVGDLGGLAGLSAMQMPLVRELARLQIVADALGTDVLDKGVITAKGRTRAAVTLWLTVVDRQQRLAERLGLERRQRPAGPSHLRDYLDGRDA